MGTHKFEADVNKHIWDDISDEVFEEYLERTFIANIIENAIYENRARWDVPSVFQWWRVGKCFAMAAFAAGEVIVETPLGTLWGRQTCGQPVYQDLNVQDILTAMHSA
ncbi:hypothetical protein Despr_3136 [Desulfobulbus propionicus DSM 2032]|uniref:Uncharacterized protein n=1 Tax=Desulfobulbus propionicus (strain ATCC 33891 / DSM 2032 / VKM B-1956 / 1pr3) TaxID=577650 RepID=A0A7U3YQ13_DESPD|nr:hypothetical protein [Desulfobulbus propionicus]ADW19266.1 hypothetical protein Despr_3136 [Desulfobulbus propionicus DSM 2032]